MGGKLPGFLSSHRRPIIFSCFHATLLVFATYGWMNLNLSFADEMVKIARVNQVVQFLLLDKDDETTATVKSKLILINCSYDKMLVPYEDDYGSGTRAVINRQLLAQMVRIVRQAKPEMVIWDILLDNPSDFDDSLYAELHEVPFLIMSSYLNEDGTLNRPREGFPHARAQYSTNLNTFLKYQLMDSDTMKYVPSIMYEHTTGDTLRRIGPLVKSRRGWWLNSFIVDLPIRQSHIDVNEVTMWNLGEALKYTAPEEIQELTAGKIVVIGDFLEFDVHQTLLGEQPGPLIMVNTYIGLLKGIPMLSAWAFLLIFMLYFVCSFYILRMHSFRRHLQTNRVFRMKVIKFVLRYFSYIVMFSAYTMILYLLTEKHFELILFALYFNLFEFIVRKNRRSVEAILYPLKASTASG